MRLPLGWWRAAPRASEWPCLAAQAMGGAPQQCTADMLPRRCGAATAVLHDGNPLPMLQRPRPQKRRKVTWFGSRRSPRDYSGDLGAECWRKPNNERIDGSTSSSSRSAQHSGNTVAPAVAAPARMCCQAQIRRASPGLLASLLSVPIRRAPSRFWVRLNSHACHSTIENHTKMPASGPTRRAFAARATAQTRQAL